VGVDNLDIPALSRAGVWAFNVPDYCIEETSTHTLALLLSWQRGVVAQDRRVKAGDWSIRADGTPRRLSECRLGLLGFGRIGRAVAVKARPFFASIVAHDPAVSDDEIVAFGAKPASTEEVLSTADFVSLHADLRRPAKALIDDEALLRVKPGAVLINTARGGLVDNHSVLRALREDRLAAYCTDVFSPDDDVSSELAGRADVIVTCHRSFLSDTADRSVRVRVATEVARVLRSGEPPRLGRLA
jgi:D-3-phosphoglycerate dehydrogenase